MSLKVAKNLRQWTLDKLSERHYFIFLSDLTMTFLEFKDTIEENDLAILYINFTTIIPVTVKPMTLSKKGTCEVENIYQTKYGSLKAMDLVGKKFGSKVQLSKGYGYILHVSSEMDCETIIYLNIICSPRQICGLSACPTGHKSFTALTSL